MSLARQRRFSIADEGFNRFLECNRAEPGIIQLREQGRKKCRRNQSGFGRTRYIHTSMYSPCAEFQRRSHLPSPSIINNYLSNSIANLTRTSYSPLTTSLALGFVKNKTDIWRNNWQKRKKLYPVNSDLDFLSSFLVLSIVLQIFYSSYSRR